MSDRLGPPSPRSAPWTPPPQSEPARTPERDLAWIEWLKATGQFEQGYDIGQRAVAKYAFIAGWEARKTAQYKSLVDNRTPGVSTLFPTDAELDHGH